ncbi:MAG: nicotinamide-nucleotide amidohydrolase family protein [Deltaproteobacteria bacterium]|nr:nicotinamide-nucleotide amidohydrolase family protein [Deltaproteobacteria bacterium]
MTDSIPQDPNTHFPGPALYARAASLGRRLRELGLTLATAESLTGGLVSAAVTSVPGSSAYFLAGLNTYSNQSKYRLLEVPWVVLNTAGAVSPECARAMASGVARLTGSDLGLSTTGIAGPDGGSEIKPVGLVYVSVYGGGRHETKREIFTGDRQTVAFRAVEAAMELLGKFLEDRNPG